MTTRRFNRLALLLLLILACSMAFGAAPRNVILMIGDGMGIGQITLGRLAVGDSGKLNIDSMHYTGFEKTRSANATVTDSAASGTAMATGHKTNNGMIGVLPDGTSVENIREASEKIGKSTGLVTTTTITHATPASFGSHVSSRGDEADIAVQYMNYKIDVLLGGGKKYFVPAGSRDGKDLLATAKAAGYTMVDTRDDLLSAHGNKLLGLFEDEGMTTESPEPTLAEMTQKAIDTLSTDKDGFFLMVEGGQIDWKAHENNADGVVKQFLDFDSAIGKALDYARKQKNTLVIVTADHETGGLAVAEPKPGEKNAANWTTKGHSGNMVGIFADGMGADNFTGVLDNTDIPKHIALFLGIKNFASK